MQGIGSKRQAPSADMRSAEPLPMPTIAAYSALLGTATFFGLPRL